jgi:hypothetical protein
VIIWDEGRAEILRDEPGHLSFILHGHKLSGRFGLTRTGEHRWILVKVRDEGAREGSDIVADQPASVRSGRTWQELAGGQASDRGPTQDDGLAQDGGHLCTGLRQPASATGPSAARIRGTGPTQHAPATVPAAHESTGPGGGHVIR